MKLLGKITYLFLTVICCVISQAANNNYRNITIQNLPNQLGVFKQFEFNVYTEETPVNFNVVVLNTKYRARLFQQKENIQFFANYLNTLSNKEDFIVGINGGFYDSDFRPTGLFIEKGKVVQRTAHNSLLKACVAINKNYKITLETNLNHCENAFYAMQTGPVLLSQGKINNELAILQQKSTRMQAFFSPHKRTILASANDNTLLIITTSPVTLLGAATILQNYSPVFGVEKINTAINLDGGSSTGMYVRLPVQPFYFQELKHVKTFVFFN